MTDVQTAPPLVELEHISKSFELHGNTQLPVLADISVSAEEGDFVALVGPSGCGKSTMLGILSGILDYDAGDAVIPPASEISYVFQTARLLPWRTVLENIEVTRNARAAARGRGYDNDAEYYLDAAGLWNYRDFYPRAISGGMQQRAAIARALSTEPRLLLMDEPFSSLDELTAREQRAFLQDLWLRYRTTIVFVTHNVLEAISLATKVVVVSARPARVLREIVIDVERPRKLADPKVNAIQNEILNLLGVDETGHLL